MDFKSQLKIVGAPLACLLLVAVFSLLVGLPAARGQSPGGEEAGEDGPGRSEEAQDAAPEGGPAGEGGQAEAGAEDEGVPAEGVEPGADSEQARQVALRIQKVYENTNDLVANFEQEYEFRVTGAVRRSSGKVYFKVPGLMRWDYEKPEARFFVTDGDNLFVYEPQARQAMRQPLVDSGLAESVAFLFGRGDLLGSFRVSMQEPSPQGNHRLRLLPVQDEGHYRQVILEVDPSSGYVVMSEVEDPTGNRNRIRFRDMKFNVGLTDKGFQNPIPKGVRVVETGGPL